MSVEVKNLQTGETFTVGADGAVIGRMGGGASIQVDDRSVSKKHARIFSDGAQWFVEDMGSVNGTVVDGNKIGGAVALASGLVFSLSKHRFEVVRLPGRAGGQGAVPPEQETRTAMRSNNAANLPSDLRKDPVPRKRPPPPPPAAPPPRPSYDDDLAPPEPTRGPDLPLASDHEYPSQSAGIPSGGDGGDERPIFGADDYDELTPGEAISLGMGYLLKTTPLLALNPPGTVREHIASPPMPALEKVPLALMVAPMLAVMVTILGGAGAVASAVPGNLPIGGLILAPVIGVVVGALMAVITGFVSHPVLAWLVDKLGGSSDARSRTAHVAMMVGATVVMAVATSLATIVAAMVARLTSVSSIFALLAIIPALISLVALPLVVFVQWSWWKFYGVARWFQMLLLVGMAAMALLGLKGVVDSVSGAVSVIRSSGGPTPDVVVPTPGTPTPDTPTPDTPTPDTPTPDTPDVPTPSPSPTPSPTPSPAPTATPTKVDPTLPGTKVQVDDGFVTYARKRGEIEALLEKDPTLVVRLPKVQGLYKELLERTDSAENDVFREFDGRKRSSWLNPLYEKARRARVYDRCRDLVNRLHRELFSG